MRIGLPKVHGQICIGLPTVHGRFGIGPPQVSHAIGPTRFPVGEFRVTIAIMQEKHYNVLFEIEFKRHIYQFGTNIIFLDE